MKVLIGGLLLLLVGGHAYAQTTIINNGPMAAQARVGLDGHRTSVQVSFQIGQALPVGNGDFSVAMGAANHSLLDLIDRECAALVNTFPGNCRVTQANVSVNIGVRGIPSTPTQLTGSAAATYDIEAVSDPATKP